MKSRRVFADFNVSKRNDIMTAFDIMIYNTVCMLDRMSASQVNKNKERKCVRGYKGTMNMYEDTLVNEIENLLNPSSITTENSVYEHHNSNSNTENLVLPEIDQYDYRTQCNSLSNRVNKYNRTNANKRRHQFQLQRNKQPHVPRFNTNDRRSKFIHASKCVVSNKNNNSIPFGHCGSTNRNKYCKLAIGHLNNSPPKYE